MCVVLAVPEDIWLVPVAGEVSPVVKPLNRARYARGQYYRCITCNFAVASLARRADAGSFLLRKHS